MAELQKINTEVVLNLRDQTENVIVSANRGDTNSRTIMFSFVYDDEIYTIPDGTIARFIRQAKNTRDFSHGMNWQE